MKRWLFLTHRWLGVALAVFMSLWFVSGLAIMYTGSVTQTRSQQLAHADELQPAAGAGWLSLGDAWERSSEGRKQLAGKAAPLADARLVRLGGEPLWLLDDERNQRFAVSAVSGEVQKFAPEQALRIAQHWLRQDSGSGVIPAVQYVDTEDYYSSLRNYQNLKPFHRFAVDDGRGTELLISARSGEVLQAATRVTRALNYAGNWLHLFRPLDSIGWGESRRDVLLWAGGLAFVAGLTGLIVGWLVWRPGWGGKRTYSQGRVHPYRAAWFRWHFWAGLLGGTLAVLWAFSGYLVGNPWQIFSPANASREELSRYQGKAFAPAVLNWQPGKEVLAPGVVELSWRRLGDQTVLLAYTRDGQRLPQNGTATATSFCEADVVAAASRLLGGAEVVGQTVLNEYDRYYYPNHRQDALDKPLPVVRVELADAGHTQVYVDPQDGRLLQKQDDSRRAYRWLFSAIHHWDIGALYQRPLWDGWMLVWIAFGLVLSVSSVVIGWQRLRRTFRRRQAEDEPQLAQAEAS